MPSSRSDRVSWQQERDTLRRAQSQGISIREYEDQIREEELEEKTPSETDLEEVAVVVYFPNVRPSEINNNWQSHFMLKARISTLAIEGLMPDEVADLEGQAGAGGSVPGAGTTGGDR